MGSYNRPPERPARFGDSPFLIFKNQLSGRGAGLLIFTGPENAWDCLARAFFNSVFKRNAIQMNQSSIQPTLFFADSQPVYGFEDRPFSAIVTGGFELCGSPSMLTRKVNGSCRWRPMIN